MPEPLTPDLNSLSCLLYLFLDSYTLASHFQTWLGIPVSCSTLTILHWRSTRGGYSQLVQQRAHFVTEEEDHSFLITSSSPQLFPPSMETSFPISGMFTYPEMLRQEVFFTFLFVFKYFFSFLEKREHYHIVLKLANVQDSHMRSVLNIIPSMVSLYG